MAPAPIRIGTILHPTDFSPSSDRALEWARALASLAGAELHLLHVVGYPEDLRPSETAMRKAVGEAEKRVRALAGEGAQAAVRVGSAAHEIIRYARDEKIELVVMGTVGLHGEPGVPVGSVAEKVLRGLTVPVLTVKAPPPAKKAAGRTCAMCGSAALDVLCDACKDRVRGEAVARRR
jgi:nucleotide-binding universal stress UspA family protein